LTLRLSEGTQGCRRRIARSCRRKPLGDAEVAAPPGAVKRRWRRTRRREGPALRDRSTPPPRTGKTVKDKFPGPGVAARPPVTADAGKALEVIRFAPEGDVPLAPMVTITFSQPMVAVTSQDDAAKTVPVTMTPTPPGRWRWLGTKTLVFDPVVRFPQATTYTIHIPKGTVSATGNVLAAAKRFTFTTPTPRMQASWPTSGPQRLDAPMFIAFDQKIDAAAVLATIKVDAAGKAYPIRQLTADEIEKHETLEALVDGIKKADQDGRWIAFRAEREFPKDTHVTISIGPGTPSAEGPNKSTDKQSFSFETYPPLRIVRAECGWGECPPGAPFSIELNNPLDTERWDDSQLSLTPAVPRTKIIQQGNYLTVQAATKALTTYTARLSGGVVDQFGQTWQDADLQWKVGEACQLRPVGMIALDPAAKAPTSTSSPPTTTRSRSSSTRSRPATGAPTATTWSISGAQEPPGCRARR
jgi:hypothetical protein